MATSDPQNLSTSTITNPSQPTLPSPTKTPKRRRAPQTPPTRIRPTPQPTPTPASPTRRNCRRNCRLLRLLRPKKRPTAKQAVNFAFHTADSLTRLPWFALASRQDLLLAPPPLPVEKSASSREEELSEGDELFDEGWEIVAEEVPVKLEGDAMPSQEELRMAVERGGFSVEWFDGGYVLREKHGQNEQEDFEDGEFQTAEEEFSYEDGTECSADGSRQFSVDEAETVSEELPNAASDDMNKEAISEVLSDNADERSKGPSSPGETFSSTSSVPMVCWTRFSQVPVLYGEGVRGSCCGDDLLVCALFDAESDSEDEQVTVEWSCGGESFREKFSDSTTQTTGLVVVGEGLAVEEDEIVEVL